MLKDCADEWEMVCLYIQLSHQAYEIFLKQIHNYNILYVVNFLIHQTIFLVKNINGTIFNLFFFQIELVCYNMQQSWCLNNEQ